MCLDFKHVCLNFTLVKKRDPFYNDNFEFQKFKYNEGYMDKGMGAPN